MLGLGRRGWQPCTLSLSHVPVRLLALWGWEKPFGCWIYRPCHNHNSHAKTWKLTDRETFWLWWLMLTCVAGGHLQIGKAHLWVSVRTYPETVRPGGPKKGSVSCWIQNLNVWLEGERSSGWLERMSLGTRPSLAPSCRCSILLPDSCGLNSSALPCTLPWHNGWKPLKWWLNPPFPPLSCVCCSPSQQETQLYWYGVYIKWSADRYITQQIVLCINRI